MSTLRLTLRLVAGLGVFVAAVLAIAYWPHVRNEFFVLTGSRDEPGGWYGFHSGFGGSWIPAYIGAGALFWWHHQCHVTGCYWPTRRLTAANERACWLHHPEPKRTVHDLHRAHHAAKARR